MFRPLAADAGALGEVVAAALEGDVTELAVPALPGGVRRWSSWSSGRHARAG